MSAVAESTPRGSYTLDSVLEILEDQGVLGSDQGADIRSRQGRIAAKVIKDREKLWGKSKRSSVDDVSPAEIIAASGVSGDAGVLTIDQVMEAVAMSAGLPVYKIDMLKLDSQLVTSTVSRPFARKHSVLPLWKKDGHLTVALEDPFDLELIDNLSTLAGCPIQSVVSSRDDILKAIREVYGFRSSVDHAQEELDTSIDVGNFEQLMHLRSAEEIEATDAHIVNAVDYLLRYAFEQHASDIHVEPRRSQTIIRMRIDGVLHEVHRVPRGVHPAMASRIKGLARMDIAEKRRPQDGRIKTRHGNREVELRISTMPVAFGEKVVIRIFDPRILLQQLDGLGFSQKEFAQFKGFIRRPHGIVLVTGPTGSGKTTTLYSALQAISAPAVNIVTIEDPIEMVVEEFNQVSVQPRTGITFSSALRTILRQDPDIIMVGEIRDAETAENAIQAALTGHLVFSTLHTNDAAGAVTRLKELGVAPFLIASTVVGVIAQRLLRRICEECQEPMSLSREQCNALSLPVPRGGKSAALTVQRGKGCPACRQTGLKGRTGIFEVMPMSEVIRSLILEESDAHEILKAARNEGMMTLREAAINKLAEGRTRFEEVIRVTADAAGGI